MEFLNVAVEGGGVSCKALAGIVICQSLSAYICIHVNFYQQLFDMN